MSLMVAAGETLSVRNVRRPKATALRRRVKAEEIDRDVQEFCAKSRTLVPSAAGRRQLSRFVAGMRSLNLWKDAVCWPMRRGQRAVTGSTLHSLGGWQVADATATSTGLAEDGYNFSAAGSPSTSFSVTVAGLSALTNFHVILGSRMNSPSAANEGTFADMNPIKIIQPANNTGFVQIQGGAVVASAGTTTSAHGAYQFGRTDSIVLHAQRNFTTRTTAGTYSTAITSDNMTLGNTISSPSAKLAGVISFAAILRVGVDTSTANTICKLVLDTLLKGIA